MDWSDRTKAGKALIVGLWGVTVVEALMMGVAGSAKLFPGGRERWAEMFLEWGYPNGSSTVVGGIELLFAVVLLVPAVAAWSSIVLLIVMAAALATVVVTSSSLGVAGPLVHGALLLCILRGRWQDRFRLGG